MSINDNAMLRSALPAAVFTIGLFSSLTYLVGLRDLASVESVGVALAFFVLVYCAVRFGGRRGLGALWALLLVWLLLGQVINFLNSGYPFLYRARGMPALFFFVSIVLSLPLFFATWVGLWPLPRVTNISFASLTIAWIVLMFIARYFSYPPPSDVYVAPRFPQSVSAAVGLGVLAPVFLGIHLYFVQLLWKREV